MWRFYQSYFIVIVYYQYIWVIGPSVRNTAIYFQTPSLVCQVGLFLGQVITHEDFEGDPLICVHGLVLSYLRLSLFINRAFVFLLPNLTMIALGLWGSGRGLSAPSFESLSASTRCFPRRWATSISSRNRGGWSSNWALQTSSILFFLSF